jgi:predicted transcriptional regulator
MKSSKAKLDTFHEQIRSGKLVSNNLKVYNEIAKKPQTIHELRKVLDMPHQSLTSAISHLEDIGWLIKKGTEKVERNTFTIYQAVMDYKQAEINAEAMERHKFNEWLRRGINNGWISKSLEVLPLNNVYDDLI